MPIAHVAVEPHRGRRARDIEHEVGLIAVRAPGPVDAAVVKARRADQLDGHLALDALDRAHQRVLGVVVGGWARVAAGALARVPVADRQRVRDDEPARRRHPRRLQHVGAGDVAAARRHVDPVGRDPERSRTAVEQRTEDARAVKSRQAQPLDGAVRRDQRAGVAVREERVVGDRREVGRSPGVRGVITRGVPERRGALGARGALRLPGRPPSRGERIAHRGYAELLAGAGVRVRSSSSRDTQVEASALPAGLTRGRAPLSSAFLRLRSDEQLVAMFRAGSDDAFRVIHDRYRVRLLAYARQMLRGGSGDPEDALQDVFLRAYRALRVNNRPVTLRAWLYRIAHNRCIDELRRPGPLPPSSRPTPSRRSADRSARTSRPRSPNAARRSPGSSPTCRRCPASSARRC